MKIGFLVNNLNTSAGGGRYASELIDGVKKYGHEVIVLTEAGEGSNAILKRGLGVFSSAFKARKILKDCDIIHAIDGYPCSIIGALVNKSLRKKFIVTLYGTYAIAPLYGYRTSWLIKWAYRQAGVLVAISSYTRDEILKKINLNIAVVNPGLDLEKFYQKHEESEDKFILSVGASKERKGYHISIPAFTKFSKKFPEYKYYIVADNGREDLESIARNEGVGDRVLFFEGISDEKLLELYRKARLFILVPVSTADHHIEGFGLVYLEAAAAGTPVIGTYGTGAVDAINEGKNGLLVVQNDIDATLDAMLKILSEENVWEKMSDAGIEWVRNHNWSFVVNKYLEIYKKP